MPPAFAADDTSGRGESQAAFSSTAFSDPLHRQHRQNAHTAGSVGPALVSRVSLLGRCRQRRAQTHRPPQVVRDRIPRRHPRVGRYFLTQTLLGSGPPVGIAPGSDGAETRRLFLGTAGRLATRFTFGDVVGIEMQRAHV
jgi:hypothetical protein